MVGKFGSPIGRAIGSVALAAALSVVGLACSADRYEPALDDLPAGMVVSASVDDYVVELNEPRPLPSENWSVVLREGSGRELTAGTGVALDYELYSWSTGELVEDSSVLDGGVLDATLDPTSGLPASVVEAIIGQQAEVEIVAVLAAASPEIPEYLDQADGYYLRVVAR